MRSLVAAVVLALVAPASASALKWSTPRGVSAIDRVCAAKHPTDERRCYAFETAPRAAVNARGAAVVAWTDARGTVTVMSADRPGHFGPVQPFGRGYGPQTAIAADGAEMLAWVAGTDTQPVIRFARRPAHGRFGTPRTFTIPNPPHRGIYDVRIAQQPDGSVVAAVETSGPVWGLKIARSGTPGKATVIGYGGLDRDSVRAAADGTLALCCVSSTPFSRYSALPQSIAVFRAGVGWTTLPVALPQFTSIETVAATQRRIVVGVIAHYTSGDAGVLGVPGLVSTTSPTNTLGPVLSAFVDRPSRGLQPVVAIDGSGRNVLLYQDKTHSEAFMRTAPIWATVAPANATALPARELVYAGEGFEPLLRPLGKGTIAAWAGPHDRWHAGLELNGRFKSAPVPSGPGPSNVGRDFNYNHDMATAGGYAVLVWTTADSRVAVSEIVG